MTNQDEQQVPIVDAMRMAIEHHQAGRTDQAELIYRAILDSDPAHTGAKYNLGLIAMQAGRPKEAVPVLKAALDADPSNGAYWLNYAVALAGSGDPEAAREVLLAARRRGFAGETLAQLLKKIEQMTGAAATPSAPHSKRTDSQEITEADESTLRQIYGQKRYAEVEDLGVRLSRQYPSSARARFWVGAARVDRGQYESAAEVLERARDLQPSSPAILDVLGLTYRRLGRNQDAQRVLEQSLALAPDAFGTLLNASANAVTLREYETARRYAERALALRPDAVDALRVLADAATVGGAGEEAVLLYRRAISLNPDDGDLCANLGDALELLGRSQEAIDELQRGLALRPDHVPTLISLGEAYDRLGENKSAIKYLRRASDLAPDNVRAHTAYLFGLSHDEEITPEDSFAEHVRIGDLIEAPYRDRRYAHDNDRDPERALRIGFVSGDLRDHPVAYLVEPIWRALRTGSNLIYAYSNSAEEDEVSERLRSLTDSWVQIHRMDDATLCERIRSDRIDILVDLSGYTLHHRLAAFARKPAPIQATWIGYPGTTGLSAMDYRFVRGLDSTAGQLDRLFREKLVRFRLRGFQPEAAAPAVNALPALSAGHLTFGSFNRMSKLNKSVIALWSRVLKAIPDSRLLIGAVQDAHSRQRLLNWFAEHGIEPNRLDLRPTMPMLQFLQMHHEVDIALDTFPYSGGTTTSHALWMGVPVLTLTGPSLQQNHATVILRMLELPDWITETEADFVAQALRAASDLVALETLRQGMRERMTRQFVGTHDDVGRELDTALRLMWQRWCAGLAPASITL